jgi:hypothetical protein
MNTTNGGAASDADLDDVTANLSGFSITSPMGTVDVTKLDADAEAFFRKHIAGLRDASATSKYGDDNTGAFVRRLDLIAAGVVHTLGRGKVDIRIRPYGTGAGLLQIAVTAMPTTIPIGIELETEIGGDVSWQISGQPVLSVQ